VKRILILGGNGFIGNHLINKLLANNHFVTAFGRTASGFEMNNPENFLFVKGDFEDVKQLNEILFKQDIVYHLISRTIPANSWEKHEIEISKNLSPTLHLIELAIRNKVKKICFASSGGTVYGINNKVNHENSPTIPVTPHGIIKRTIESFLQNAKYSHNLDYDIYRISNVYGEGQNIKKGLGFINTAIENIIKNRKVTVFGDGTNIRDFVYVSDVAELMSYSVQGNENKSNIYNISLGKSYSLNEVLEIMKSVLNIDFEINYVSKRISDIPISRISNKKIIRKTKKAGLIPIDTGILNTYKYLLSKHL